MNFIFFALCILAKFLSADAKEPHEPRNIACLSGTKVIITCEVPENNSIHWYHQRNNISSPQVLTNDAGTNISTNYLMLKIENEESLVINSVQLRDAGVYYCIAINSNGVSKEVGSHLIVLASDPICDVENVTVMENDYIQVQCSVTYGGLWRPILEWTQLGFLGQEKINNDSIMLKMTESHEYARMTVSLQIISKSNHNNVSFVCSTYFDYNDMLMKHKVNYNVPDYNNTWNSPKINVLYGSRNVSIYPSSDTLYPGDKLTCSAMGNPEPGYEWTDNVTVYVGPQIDIDQSMIRDHPYVFSCKARNSLHESVANITFTVRSRFPPIYFAIVAIWLLCSLLLIGIIFAVRKYVKERIGVLNETGYGDYVDLSAFQPGNEARNLSGTRAAENSAGHNEETDPKCVGADGTQYVQMNIRPDNGAPPARSAVHHSTIEVSNYASIDHTRKAPKRRK